jgi:hypothetical protein
MNGAGRCLGPDGWGSGDVCTTDDPWSPGSIAGVRPGQIITPGRYIADPLRDRASQYNQGQFGYLRPGYDDYRMRGGR